MCPNQRLREGARGSPGKRGADSLPQAGIPRREEGRGAQAEPAARARPPAAATYPRAAARSCTCSVPAGAFPGLSGRGAGRARTFVQSCPRESQRGHKQRHRAGGGAGPGLGDPGGRGKGAPGSREAAADTASLPSGDTREVANCPGQALAEAAAPEEGGEDELWATDHRRLTPYLPPLPTPTHPHHLPHTLSCHQ